MRYHYWFSLVDRLFETLQSSVVLAEVRAMTARSPLKRMPREREKQENTEYHCRDIVGSSLASIEARTEWGGSIVAFRPRDNTRSSLWID